MMKQTLCPLYIQTARVVLHSMLEENNQLHPFLPEPKLQSFTHPSFLIFSVSAENLEKLEVSTREPLYMAFNLDRAVSASRYAVTPSFEVKIST
jgi:hypothetical protein